MTKLIPALYFPTLIMMLNNLSVHSAHLIINSTYAWPTYKLCANNHFWIKDYLVTTHPFIICHRVNLLREYLCTIPFTFICKQPRSAPLICTRCPANSTLRLFGPITLIHKTHLLHGMSNQPSSTYSSRSTIYFACV